MMTDHMLLHLLFPESGLAASIWCSEELKDVKRGESSQEVGGAVDTDEEGPEEGVAVGRRQSLR